MKNSNSYFNKADTKIIKGLAIILMLMHHLWAFPNRIPGGELKHFFDFNDGSSLMLLGMFGKICVSIFFFVGGYGIYKLSEKDDFNIFKNIKKLFINYWKVFLIFVPIGFIFFSNQIAYSNDVSIYTRYANFNIYDIIDNFLGLSSSLNSEWWFLNSYLTAIITFPLIKRLFKNKSTAFNIFIIAIYAILVTNVFPAIGNIKALNLMNNDMFTKFFLQSAPFISCFWLGILFAKDNLMVWLRERINKTIKLNIFIDIIGIGIIFYIRQFLYGATYDMVYIPFLIVFFLDFISRFKILRKIFEILGNHSTNMWLIHTFFCYYFYFFAKVVVYLKWGVPCLLVLIVLTLIASCLVNYFWDFLKDKYLELKSKLLSD